MPPHGMTDAPPRPPDTAPPTPGLARTMGLFALVVYGAGAAYVSRGVTRPRLIGLVGLNTAFAVGSGVSVLAAPLTGWGTAVALALAVVSLVVADLLVLGARGRH